MIEIQQKAQSVRNELARVIVGQHEIVDSVMIALLAGGHLLLEGVPGLAKTLLVKTLARALSVPFRRIQFTPDLMPSDIIGTNVFNMHDSSFMLRRGPIFTGLLLADEINRTPPRTQAALLEAMQERQVTIDGERYALPEVFMVCATQNPIEYEGTYPLPEAQLDRFLLKAVMYYPTPEQEVEILRGPAFDILGDSAVEVNAVLSPRDILDMRAQARSVRVEEKIYVYITQICGASRTSPQVQLGASPRASQALLACARTAAALQGRDFITPDDVKYVAPPVLRHRILLRPDAEIEGLTPDQVVAGILASVPVPR